DDRVAEVVEATGGRHPSASEKTADQRHRLGQPVEPLAEPAAEVEPEGAVLVLEPAAPEPEDQPTTADVVDRGRELRREARVAERVRGDQQAEPGPGCHRGKGRQGRPALELGVVPSGFVGQEVVVEPWSRFIARFPTVDALAAATPADVLRAWQGMGYDRRALNLRRAAQAIRDDHDGRVPDDVEALERLSGVGPYTARAVAAIAF